MSATSEDQEEGVMVKHPNTISEKPWMLFTEHTDFIVFIG